MSTRKEMITEFYDRSDENGRLETTKESLIFGIRLPDTEIGGRTFVAMLARSDLSTPEPGFWRSARGLVGIPLRWLKKVSM